MRQSAVVGVVAVALGGCASDRMQVRPVAMQEVKQVCIIENPSVSGNFLETYRKALEHKGYESRVLSVGSSLGACAITSKYDVNWTLDLVPYMSLARLDVYKNGKPAGAAVLSGRFWDAEEKVQRLVDQLFR